MTPDEARDWAEKNLDADDYIKEFGAPSESDDGGFVTITASISEASYDILKRDLTEAKMELSEYIEKLIKK